MQPELADRLMELLGIPLLSLFTQEELCGLAPPQAAEAMPLSLLEGRLGGGALYPNRTAPEARYFLPAGLPAGLLSPVLVVLDRSERSMLPLLEPGDWLLLDRSPALRRKPSFEHAYALSWKRRGLIARCRVVGQALVLVMDNPSESLRLPSHLPLAGREILNIVKGKIVWVGRELTPGA